jgi:hypothetical protein
MLKNGKNAAQIPAGAGRPLRYKVMYMALQQLLLQVAVLFFRKPLADSPALQSEYIHSIAFWLY